MLTKTKGIVLKTINYAETSVIAKIYTRELGMRSYIINGVRSVKGRTKSAMLQVLNQLDLEVYEREGKDIQRIKEMKFAEIYINIPFNITKTSVALFFAELLYKTVKEESGNPIFYDFLLEEINTLEKAESATVAQLPIYFMLNLTEFLGFYPSNATTSNDIRFDLKEGRFVAELPIKDRIVDETKSSILLQLLSSEFESWHNILVNRKQRKSIINVLELYYSWHIENFSYLRSLRVLETIF